MPEIVIKRYIQLHGKWWSFQLKFRPTELLVLYNILSRNLVAFTYITNLHQIL